MRISVPAAVLAVAALTLSACSSSSNGTPTVAPTSAGSTSSAASTPSPTGFPSSSSSSASTTGGLTEAQATAALLTAGEIGGGFSATPPDNSPDTPLPCTPNNPPLSTQFPPQVKVQSDFTGLNGKALFSEEIETYADSSTVTAIIAAGEQGLACGKATVNGVKVKIVGPTDLTTQVGTPVTKAEAWSLTSSAINAGLIIAQLGQNVVVFSFGADPSVDSSQLPDAEQIVTTGIAKLAAALK